ncbi:fimbrial protein [Klebsiella aerogenes]|uniref:fimbrial protein n=1 Tax=Klebsiella aerogenes TaxID=548 RepID=UPI0021D25180|nr:fimbrial protein [Klebsiella aerogenes]MCU6317019.1 fimbrial protein [Klebsiella aerogenes]
MKGYLAAVLSAALLCASGSGLAATVTVKGNVVQPTCSIEGISGATIEVPFGDQVVTTRIDGKEYDKQPVNYTVKCDGDMSSNSGLQISISGTLASFGSGLLQTTVTGLGVQFLNGAAALPLNTGTAKFDYNSSTRPDIYAVLARDPAVTLAAGAFSATAMMSVDYQ